MQSSERTKANSQEAIEKRGEKERKREEKELRKPAGVKLSTVIPVVGTINTTKNPAVAAAAGYLSGRVVGGYEFLALGYRAGDKIRLFGVTAIRPLFP